MLWPLSKVRIDVNRGLPSVRPSNVFILEELELGGEEARKSTFPLPTLGRRLEAQSKELHHGIGFFILRGLDPSQYSPGDRIILFLGISDYIGKRKGRQDRRKNMLSGQNFSPDQILTTTNTITSSFNGPK
jgi:hypothetical protein